MIDGQLLTDGIERLTQEAVVIEGAYQIFHDIALSLSHIEFAHLFLQLVVERDTLAIDHLLALVGKGTATMIDGQILIVTSQIAEGLIKGRLSLLALTAALEIILSLRGIAIIAPILIVRSLAVVVTRLTLERRVIIHLRIDTVDELHQWQFHQRSLQQLLVGEHLSLFLLL